MRNGTKAQHGFTLIELMIAVAIIGILAAIAYPSYTTYVQRSYRSEGIAMLTDGVARMERYYAQNNTYAAADLAALGFAMAVPKDKVTVDTPVASQSGKYKLSFKGAPGATTYTFQVVPQDAQAKDACGTLTIDQTGTRTTSLDSTKPTDSAACWK
jgi:type IV pilus assembly protein PilE